jgi:hypothetical protein
MVGYGILVGVNYLFTLGVVALFPEGVLVFSRTLALIITTLWNFIFYKIMFHEDPRAALLAHHNKLKATIRKTANWLVAHKRSFAFGVLATLPLLAFFYQYLGTGNKSFIGDFDYYAQLYEATRITILKFHQLPFWNPWISGGVPLFANPQYGLFSPQLLFTLLFGTIYGLKITYVLYAISGFWGMYALTTRIFESTRTRGLLISYIWVFCGFFAGHNISHFTFTLYFLIPWLFYFIARRNRKWSWLGLGLIESLIILVSVHYTFLMTALVLVVYFAYLYAGMITSPTTRKKWKVTARTELLFVAKVLAVVILLAGYRFIITYYFVSHNERAQVLLAEPVTTPNVLFEALFVPVDTLVKAPKTVWGWGEYSMYVGMGTGIAFLIALIGTVKNWRKLRDKTFVSSPFILAGIILVGLFALTLAPGDFSAISPFHLLHELPGFAQTRVSARWMIFLMFAILSFLASWKRNQRLINFFLMLAVIELFVSFGPPRVTGKTASPLPLPNFAPTFTTYDNGQEHLDSNVIPMHSYLYTTAGNIGQVYADDSLVDTLHGTAPTIRCGQNVNPACDLVLTDNADVTYWSPNKIVLTRTAPGRIELNMNVESGWRINDVYPFATIAKLDPTTPFALTDTSSTYTLEYAPKLSPAWLLWRFKRF